MLIKKPDDQSLNLARLEARAQGRDADAKRAEVELRNRRAGIRGEEQAAYLIDFDFASSANWAVIHDLRLEHGGRVAQVDHLLINRWMDVYVLETKSFHAGVKITEEGEFLRYNSYRKTYEGMASPVEQNERHIQVLRDVMKSVDMPMRLGLRIQPSFQSLVLVSPSARIDRPRKFDASRVIKADQLKKAIWRDIDSENALLGMLKTATKIVSGETVELVARQLAALHRPLQNPAREAVAATPSMPLLDREPIKAVTTPDRIEPVFSAPPVRGRPVAEPLSPPAVATSLVACVCKGCQSSAGSILSSKYGYYFKCLPCSANTAIRFTCEPGHAPRLRGERGVFFRDCPQCGTSVLYHRNPTAATTK